MPMSSKIIIVREDFSVPGAVVDGSADGAGAGRPETLFFQLVQSDQPDVIVLDLCTTDGGGIGAIRKLRERCAIPVLVVCAAGDPHAMAYRLAGAVESLPAPVDIGQMNTVIQGIIRLNRTVGEMVRRQETSYQISGVTYLPEQNLLRRDDGTTVRLTTSERDLLSHFLRNFRQVCSRVEISDVLYGQHRPFTDRAVDVLVNRLRKKLNFAVGPHGTDLIRTEFRRGYVLIADPSAEPVL